MNIFTLRPKRAGIVSTNEVIKLDTTQIYRLLHSFMCGLARTLDVKMGEIYLMTVELSNLKHAHFAPLAAPGELQGINFLCLFMFVH